MLKSEDQTLTMLKEVTTWRELLDALWHLPEEQLNKPIQVAAHAPYVENQVTELQPAVCVATVGGLELEGSRSCYDNKYHADDLVLYVDANPFAIDGAIAFEEDWVTPIYGKDGPTDSADQYAPDCPVGLPSAIAVRKRFESWKLKQGC